MKLFSKLFAIGLVAGVTQSAWSDITLKPENSLYKAVPGQALTIPVLAETPAENAGLDSLLFTATFDAAELDYNGDQTGTAPDWNSAFSPAAFAFVAYAEPTLTVNADDNNNFPQGDNFIYDLKFLVPNSATKGDVYTVTLASVTPGVTTQNISVEVINLFTANDDSDSTPEGTAITLDVKANDENFNLDGTSATRAITVKSVDLTGTTGATSVQIVNNQIVVTPSADYNGDIVFDYTAEVDASDAGQGTVTSTATVTVNVTAVNDAPTYTMADGIDVQVAEDSGAYTGSSAIATSISTGAANESDTLEFELSNYDTSLFTVQPVINSSTGILTFTPADDANGNTTVTAVLKETVSVTAPRLSSSSTTFDITITPVNDVPVIGTPVAQTINEDGSLTITPTMLDASDVDGDSLTVVVKSGTNYSFDGATVTPTADYFGQLTVNVKVNDGTADSADSTITVNVNSVNDVPSFTKGANQTVNEDAGSQTVNGWATNISKGPSNESGQTLTFNVSNNNNSLFSVQPTISDAGVLTYTPADDANGSATVTVSLSDTGGTANGGVDRSADQTFTITVTAVNDVPSFTKGNDVTVTEDANGTGAYSAAWATSISAGAANESDQTLTFNVAAANTALFSTQPAIDASGNLTFTTATNANGSTTVTVSLSDNGGTSNGGDDKSDDQTFTVTITPVNDAPVIDISKISLSTTSIPNNADNSTSITVNGVDAASITDIETDFANMTIAYQWMISKDGGAYSDITQTSGTAATLTGADRAAAAAGFSVYYAVKCEVSVTDRGTDSDSSDTTNITTVYGDTAEESKLTATVGNTPPVITVLKEASSVNENESVDFEISTKDGGIPTQDGIASIVWSTQKNSEAWVEVQDNDKTATGVNAVTDLYTFGPNNNDQLHDGSNTWKVRVIVTDGLQPNGVTAEKIWTVTVVDQNSTPVISGTPETDVNQDVAYSFMPATSDDDAEDAAALLTNPFSISGKPDWATFNTQTGALTGTPDNSDVGGTYDNIVISFTDGAGAKVDLAAFEISVNNVNDLPNAVADVDSTDQNSEVGIIAVDNDTDIDISGQFNQANVDGDVLTVKTISNPSKGTVSVSADKTTVTYNPNGEYDYLDQGENAQEVLNYTVQDGNGGEDSSTVTITVNGLNDAPAVDSIKIEARNSSDEKVPASKPDEIAKLVAIVNASDVDNNDATLDTKNVKFVLTRKGEASPFEYAVPNVSDFDKTAALEISATPANFSLSEFLKDDKVEVFVTVNDGTADSEERTKKVTIGNPPWFPVVALADFVDGDVSLDGTYRLVYSVKDGMEVATIDATINSEKTEVLPIDYINGSWEYTVAGLKKSTTYVISSITKYNKATMSYDEVVAVDPDAEIVVDDYDAAVAEEPSGAEDINPANTLSLESVQFVSQYTNTFAFTTELSDVSGYTYTLTSDVGVDKSKTVFIMPDSDGAISTGDTVVINETLTEDGTYTFTIIPINPESGLTGGSPSTASFTFVKADYLDPTTDPSVNPDDAGADWSKMIPGGGIDYYGRDSKPTEPQNVGAVDEGGSKKVTFSWPSVPWASNYLVYLATADGQDVPGLGRVPATDTTVDITLKPGLYQWYVIARNRNGYSEEWSDVAWFIVDTTGGATLPTVSAASVLLVPENDEVVVTGVTNASTIQVYILKDGKPFAFANNVKADSNGDFAVMLEEDVTSGGTYKVYVNAFGTDNVSTGFQEAGSVSIITPPVNPLP